MDFVENADLKNERKLRRRAYIRAYSNYQYHVIPGVKSEVNTLRNINRYKKDINDPSLTLEERQQALNKLWFLDMVSWRYFSDFNRKIFSDKQLNKLQSKIKKRKMTDENKVNEQNVEVNDAIESSDNTRCRWVDVQEDGSESQCCLQIAPKNPLYQMTGEGYCDQHQELSNTFRRILHYYIEDTLGILDKTLAKELKQSVGNWKKDVEQEVGMTQYKLKKLIHTLHANGMGISKMIDYIDN